MIIVLKNSTTVLAYCLGHFRNLDFRNGEGKGQKGSGTKVPQWSPGAKVHTFFCLYGCER